MALGLGLASVIAMIPLAAKAPILPALGYLGATALFELGLYFAVVGQPADAFVCLAPALGIAGVAFFMHMRERDRRRVEEQRWEE